MTFINRSPDMAAMHQDSSENRDTIQEKLMEVFGVNTKTIYTFRVLKYIAVFRIAYLLRKKS